jgi:RepB DNA-primase from phage plasmid
MSTHGVKSKSTYSAFSHGEHSEASILFGALFGDYFNSLGDDLSSSKARIALAWQKGSKWRHEYFADTFLAGCRADELREEQVNSYFSVAPRSRESRKDSSIPRLLTLHLDVDRYDHSVEQKIRRDQPSALVCSGHGLHAYWFLDAPAPIKQKLLIRSLNQGIAREFSGDINATDVGRVLRIPGTFNVKNPNDPKQVELVECDTKIRYPLNYLIERFGSNLQTLLPEAVKVSLFEPIPRGRFLGAEDREYVERLLSEGLFEPESRNKSTLKLSRHCLEQGLSKDEAKEFIVRFFEENHNNFSKDWLADREGCIRHIGAVVDDCWKKAPEWRQVYRGREIGSRKLSAGDLEYIESLNLGNRDKAFVTDTLEFILNHQRNGVIILEKRQIERFRYCHSRNYKKRYALLESLRIIKFKAEHKKARRLATEFHVLYEFRSDKTYEHQLIAA